MAESRLVLRNCRAVTPDGMLTDAAITIASGRIVAIEPQPQEAADALDLGGLTLLPGFIDLHIHGAGGADAHAGEIAALAAFLPRCGVTAFLPTLAADAEEHHRRPPRRCRRDDIAQASGALLEPRAARRAHLEGPFLNPARAGAIPPEYMFPAEPARPRPPARCRPRRGPPDDHRPDAPGALISSRTSPSSASSPASLPPPPTTTSSAARSTRARGTPTPLQRHDRHAHRAPGTAGAALTRTTAPLSN
ncbi:MAG: hypothetical protein U0232_16195 [Thermomicrobiales bacterium]